MSYNEADLLLSIQKGDTEAFTPLVETYQKPVYNLCYRMLGNPQEAEDAAQETFWRAYQAINRYDPKRSFITWLLSIAAHYCIDQQRKRKLPTFDIDMLPEGNVPDNTPNPEKSVSRSEEEQYLHKMLNKLNSKDRAILILRYWYEFSEKEISETMNLSVSAVKSRLFRARKDMAALWSETQAKNLNSGGQKNVSPAF